MSSGKLTERSNATVTAWDFIKDNYDPDDRLAVVIKNPHENRVTQRMDTAKAIASPDFQKWLLDHNEHGAEIYLTTNTLMPKSSTRTRQDVVVIRHVYLDIDAEEARSSFDQRHLFAAEVQYTTGQGMGGGALMDGAKGQWLKGWTMTSQLTIGSGLPVTPRYLTPAGGTGIIGTVRGSLTGVSSTAPDGYYANPAAYVAPPEGSWGTAGRNSITGPAQFGMNASLGRAFAWGERSTLDCRLEATNVLNHVTYSGINSVVGSSQFGLANRANTMRKLQMSARLRF